MKMTIKVTGTDEIARKLRAMGKALTEKTLVPIISDNVQPIADDMRSMARRRSGEMANSVTVSTTLSPHQAAIVEPIAPVEVYAGPGPLPQAIQEEFGNVHEAPHPFIRPAFDSGVKRAVDGIASDGIDAILDAAKRG